MHKLLPKIDSPLELHQMSAAELKQLAAHALESQKTFDDFAAAVRQELPQVDRVCLTTISDGELRVEKASYPGKVIDHMTINPNGAPTALCRSIADRTTPWRNPVGQRR